MKFKCRFCNGHHEDSIGGYYEKKYCEAKYYTKKLNNLDPKDPNYKKDFNKYTQLLKHARYVGD